MNMAKRIGITVAGPISVELDSELEGEELANHINDLITEALRARGVHVINNKLQIFEVWDPSEEESQKSS
jgi:hypothetical protein